MRIICAVFGWQSGGSVRTACICHGAGNDGESVETEQTAVQTENAERSRENTLEAGKTAEDSAGETGGTGAGIFFLLWKKRNGDEEE